MGDDVLSDSPQRNLDFLFCFASNRSYLDYWVSIKSGKWEKERQVSNGTPGIGVQLFLGLSIKPHVPILFWFSAIRQLKVMSTSDRQWCYFQANLFLCYNCFCPKHIYILYKPRQELNENEQWHCNDTWVAIVTIDTWQISQFLETSKVYSHRVVEASWP